MPPLQNFQELAHALGIVCMGRGVYGGRARKGTPSPMVCKSMKGLPAGSQEICLPSLLPSPDGSFWHYGSQLGP